MSVPRHSTRRAWLLVALTIAYPLLHKDVSDVFDWASARWGFPAYNRAALIAIPLVSILAMLPALARRRHLLLRAPTLAGVLVLTALTWAAQRWLMVVNIELIHLPQIALIAAVAISLGLSGPAAYLTATAAGAVDETYQHLVVYAGRSDTYFDINDIVINAIGAAWAVVLFAGTFRRSDAAASGAHEHAIESPRRWGAWPLGVAIALVALPVAWWLDPPQFSPLLRPTAGGRKLYRVLSSAEGVVACGLLWAMVTALTRRTRVHVAVPTAKVQHGSLWLILLIPIASLEGCASVPAGGGVAQSPALLTQPTASSSFITTFWCGPPLAEFDDMRAAEVAAAGFTSVGPPCEGGTDAARNLRALDVAARHGLKMWIADPRFDERARGRPNWEAEIAAAVSDYRNHPAFGGYFVADEPSAAQFDDLAFIFARLQAGSDAMAYVNLLPDYFPGGLGTRTYREYVERFMTTVRPRLLSYDYYPFRVNGDRPTFFTSLALMGELSRQHDVPFMLIVLAMPHGGYRDPTEAELSWQAFHALAFGARALSYFAYWTPVNVEYADVLKFRHGLIEKGQPTVHYFQAMRLNRAVRTIGDQLAGFRSVGVGDSMGEVAAPLPLGPIAAIQGAPITAGLFADGSGRFAALLVNRDYRRAAAVTLRLREGERLPEHFDGETGVWSPDTGRPLKLPAGGAQLIRWARRG